jgi:hypothetical protein
VVQYFRMKRLLLVAQVFPPAPSPGALRPGYLARYLAQFGWNVTTLTETAEEPPFPARVIHTGSQSPALGDRIRTRIAAHAADPYSPVRVMLRELKEMLLFPDATAQWMAPAIRAGSKLLSTEHYDAILSTAHPPSVHVVAWILARKYGLPWIADYRDPWAGNAYLRRGPLRSMLERLLERGMLHRAKAITTISQPIADQIGSFHRRRDVHVIPNAYDPSDWDAIPDTIPRRFDLCYTGSMYDGKRSPELLFAALAQLRAAGDPAGQAARVHFYGQNSDNVAGSALRCGVNLIVRQHGKVPRSTAMRAQRSAAALLIFLNMDPATAHEMGSKYLEYLGARRPIIAFGPPGSVMRPFIDKHGLGWYASNVTEAEHAIRSAYARFETGRIDVAFNAREIPSARQLAATFAGVLDAVCGRELDEPRAFIHSSST